MYLVSSCLVGINCRYNGGNSEHKAIVELVNQGKAIPVCPEQLAGLLTPRSSCEIVTYENGDIKVISKDGRDFTKQFIEGAKKTLAIAKAIGIKKAILKSKSPSCGCGLIYDGTFSGNLIEGNGLVAELLIKNNVEVYTENNLDMLVV
ncbi:DUF523 domain-containing protein [Tissierella carlieri]|uniref:DUF523 domain-containing protein n=1 Tax=Tissierella carlieri TaxID=689904 RepID=A0ABT1SC86_9FIRM|nr:DUF523 domain-containing protein [Tissierella carlieri]MCQ4923582.1 DUF523 domain-containing protein [Tissierella carlieri]